jgi:hypothetical protein
MFEKSPPPPFKKGGCLPTQTGGTTEEPAFELTVTNASGLQDKAKVVIAVFGVSN